MKLYNNSITLCLVTIFTGSLCDNLLKKCLCDILFKTHQKQLEAELAARRMEVAMIETDNHNAHGNV